jgi:hypothetical protein
MYVSAQSRVPDVRRTGNVDSDAACQGRVRLDTVCQSTVYPDRARQVAVRPDVECQGICHPNGTRQGPVRRDATTTVWKGQQKRALYGDS